jgi:hypothetical protein
MKLVLRIGFMSLFFVVFFSWVKKTYFIMLNNLRTPEKIAIKKPKRKIGAGAKFFS